MDVDKEQKWVEIYHQYVNLIRSAVSNTVRGEHLSASFLEECTQESWLRIYRYWDRIADKTGKDLYNALYTITVHSTLNYLKTEQRLYFKPRDMVARQTTSKLEPDEVFQVYLFIKNLERGLDDVLTDRMKDILYMYYDYRMSLQEVADHLGVSHQAIQSSFSRAHELLDTETGVDPRELFMVVESGLYDGCIEYGKTTDFDQDILDDDDGMDNESDYWREFTNEGD